MVDEGLNQVMYATKRRRRSVKSVKTPMKDPPKSNPSKRHRLRLNGELDHLASLLPFEQTVISRLDRLSILRLAVSYLRTKSFFQAALHERYALEGHHHMNHIYSHDQPGVTDSESVLQALNGFLFIVNCDGEVFFASRTVEQYLGFHQSDIIHQSALELIHSEDREDFKAHLSWRSLLPQDRQDMTPQEVLLPENSHLLCRSFTVRFRCLLDNTSGFITLEINGHIKVLHGQSLKGEEPPLALFAMCCPFGPLPIMDMPARDYTFKSKHKMDMAPLSMDHRGKLLFGYSDHDLMEKGGYDLIHPDDLTYYAAAHQELIKTGSSGMIAYRLLAKDFRWLWLQTSSKVVYKNSKPDFVICTHRHLTDDEGRDLVGKRGTEFKLPYPLIDTDTSGLGPFDEDITKLKSQKKKSKTQLKDYLQTGRKRKTPYREAFNGLNGYSSYTGLNGYPTCQTGDMKPEIMYPYGSNNYGLDTSADLYRTSYPAFTGTVYPPTDSFRLDADKQNYTNSYYLEPRQYPHTLQYHSNGYTDFMSSAKYGYDVSKYGYDSMSSYGLDLTRKGFYDDEHSKYDSELRKYSHDPYSADKLSRVNGTLDPLKTGSLYGNSNPLLNNESLLSCGSVPHNTNSPCSLYRTDASSMGIDSRYSQDSYMPKDTSYLSKDTGYIPKDSSYLSKESDRLGKDSMVGSEPKHTQLTLPNGHASVIRNASPRVKSPRNDRSSSLYNTSEAGSMSCITSGWQHCSKTSPGNTSSQSDLSQPTSMTSIGMDQSRIMSPIVSKEDNSTPVALNSMTAHSNPSPALATTATSVIQSGRNRSCDKQGSLPGSIPVPVVKSPSWYHHLSSSNTSSYDWHLSSNTDAYSTHQRALTDPIHARSVIEAPKFATMKVGESNPLLTFSEVTSTLLNGD